jgi:hypothetical protein
VKFSARIVLLVTIWAFFLSGCEAISKAARFTPGPANSIFFQDDFSDPGSGWKELKDGPRIAEYREGAFLMQIPEAGFSYLSTPGITVKDTRIDVDVNKIDGPDDNSFGILCRYQDEFNYYSMVISSDGYYGIVKNRDGKHTILGADGLQVSESIQKGNSTNHLQANCSGSQLELIVNGSLLLSVNDLDFSQGDVGVIGSTSSIAGLELNFDNFIVQRP